MEAGVGTSHRPAANGFVVWLVLGLIGAASFLVGGFIVKDRCLHDLIRPNAPGWRGQQYSSNCYSDITALYGGRQFNEGHPIAYRDTNLEYPALTGLFITAVNAPVRTGDCAAGGLCGIRGFYVANVLALVPFALLGTACLVAIATRRRRILYFALAPATLAYAFHNWDLIPVGLTAAAMWAFARRKDGLSGILLGLGAAAKLYPAFIVPVFMAARFRDKDWDRSGVLFAGAVGGFLVPNFVVLLVAGFDGWWHPWQFQGKRTANYETSWFFIQRHLRRFASDAFWFKTYPIIAQWTSTVLFLAAGVALVWRELRRERFRPFVTAFGIVILFLVTAKVYSPQYALWLLPFFVVVGIPLWGYGLFVVSDLFVLGGIWWYLTAVQYPEQIGTTSADLRLNVLEVAVWFRYAVLLVILWLSRRAPELADHRAEPLATPVTAAV